MLFETNYSYARLFTYATADNPVAAPLSKYDWGPVAADQTHGERMAMDSRTTFSISITSTNCRSAKAAGSARR